MMAVRTALPDGLRGCGVVRGYFSEVLELVADNSFRASAAHWPGVNPAEPRGPRAGRCCRGAQVRSFHGMEEVDGSNPSRSTNLNSNNTKTYDSG
jgi:hypothetical protein